MVDLTSIAAVTSSLKAASDITQAAIGLRDGQALQAKVIELNGLILDAQRGAFSVHTDHFALIERVRELESQIAGFEAWDTKEKRYELHNWASGSFTYRLKEGVQPTEPMHHACPKCFEERKRFVMSAFDDMQHHRLKCPNCSLVLITGDNDRAKRMMEKMNSRPTRNLYY